MAGIEQRRTIRNIGGIKVRALIKQHQETVGLTADCIKYNPTYSLI